MYQHPPTVDRDGPRVAKKLAPTQPGAIKLARRYGEALLCVRYRRSADGRQRLTTVELIVECVPVQSVRSGGHAEAVVDVRIGYDEAGLRARARDMGWRRISLLRAAFSSHRSDRKSTPPTASGKPSPLLMGTQRI